MSRHFAFDERTYNYLLETSIREPEIARRLREETQQRENAQMQIGPDQGQFMQLLVQLLRAKKTIEVGVFTGYSALWVAMGLPRDGRVIACDISEEYTSVARRYWKEAGVDKKIELRIGPALETLDELVRSGQAETFDFAFIDADKTNYENYYERALRLLRVGGLIAIDNTIWSGKVADRAQQDDDTVAIRRLNEKLFRDERITLSMLTVGDGLTLALKR
ncbi:MAG TPA: class I SAM-dependent methyltransferase [Pyrinomonadaceae bacterium]|nr:class I SAM-dependent methyltransferase [Pyrinomonadaceae bacterium]